MSLIENERELAICNRENAIKIASMLIDEGYVVMLSKEENLTILNCIYTSECANRNEVVFMSRETFEEYTLTNE